VLAAILKRRLPAAASNRLMQTPAHAQRPLSVALFMTTTLWHLDAAE
jgi:hypothetical protein